MNKYKDYIVFGIIIIFGALIFIILYNNIDQVSTKEEIKEEEKIVDKKEEYTEEIDEFTYPMYLKNNECQKLNEYGFLENDKIRTILVDNELNVKVKIDKINRKIYINRKEVSSKALENAFAISEVCLYNKYILIKLGYSETGIVYIYNIEGRLVESFLTGVGSYYNVENNLITSYSASGDRINTQTLTTKLIDLSKDEISVKENEETYNCSEYDIDTDTSKFDKKEEVKYLYCYGL